MQLYVGMRTAHCRLLRRARCVEQYRILFTQRSGVFTIREDGRHALGDDELRALATADGFGSVGDFLAFFRRSYGLPFQGVVIRWDIDGAADG